MFPSHDPSIKRISEWVCVEHKTNFPKRKAAQWWSEHTDEPRPWTAKQAKYMIRDLEMQGKWKWPTQVTVREEEGEKWPKIERLLFSPVAHEFTIYKDDDIPF